MDKLVNIGKSLVDSNEITQDDEKNSISQNNVISIPLHNLRTHGLIVGMTGSGKTGLGISLLENLILNDVPLIIIDPKADLTNLLLPFDSEASKKLGIDDATINSWQSKLIDDGIDKETIDEYKDKISINLYTPGDFEGHNVALWHFNPKEIKEDKNVSEDEIQGLLERKSASLLELLSYENISIENPLLIFLSKILAEFLSLAEDFSLEALIKFVLNPPFNQIGAIPLDIFCSSKDRQEFALKLNSLLISSNAKKIFSGEELNLAEVFRNSGRAFSNLESDGLNHDAKDGASLKKKVLLFSLRALDEKERMLFVENILSELIYQIRALDGSENLRACFYMDEVYGYFPPIAMPPAKRSLITLIKQARSQGLSILLSTQNPSDIDYKALSNISNIFIGRLNSETDREKVISMILSNMNSRYSRDELEHIIASLQTREFIYCSAKESSLLKFRSRQTISYLAGPLTARRLKEIGAIDTNGQQVNDDIVSSSGVYSETSTSDTFTTNKPDVANRPDEFDLPSARSSENSNGSSLENKISNDGLSSQSQGTTQTKDFMVREPSNVEYVDKSDFSDTTNLADNENPTTSTSSTISTSSTTSRSSESSIASYFKNDLPYQVYYDNRQVENSAVYKPTIYSSISILFNDRNMSEPVEKKLDFSYPIMDTISLVNFDEALDDTPNESDLEKQAKLDLPYSELPKAMLRKTVLNNLQKKLVDKIYRNEKLSLYYHPKLKVYSEPNESMEDFIERCEDLNQDSLGAKEDKIDAKYDKKRDTVLNQIYRLQEQIEKAKMRVDRQKLNTVVQTGSTILDLLIGGGKRKSSIITRAGSSTKSHARSRELSSELELLEEKMAKLQEKLHEIDQAHNEELVDLQNDYEVMEDDIVEKNLSLLKKDIFVNNFIFYWRS